MEIGLLKSGINVPSPLDKLCDDRKGGVGTGRAGGGGGWAQSANRLTAGQPQLCGKYTVFVQDSAKLLVSQRHRKSARTSDGSWPGSLVAVCMM